uniref:Uncharacterized protein n=1 Tax=Arundo donax TaxID=35708 RepID=A0A0A9DCH3_ARUDO
MMELRYTFSLFRYQGGLLVAGPGIDNIVHVHKDKEAGDDPDMQDISWQLVVPRF